MADADTAMTDAPRVAKRRSHTKSRKGCFQCKARHTKCSESRPTCANCARLEISCTWPPHTSESQSNSNTSPENHVSPSHDSSVSTPSENLTHKHSLELSIPDMRLLHHWLSVAHRAQHYNCDDASECWRTAIVEMGFENPFLLHGLLALSAVHKCSTIQPSERQSLLLQADTHVSQALETMHKVLDTMRHNLETPDFDFAVPVFVLSSILLAYNFGVAQERPEDPIRSFHHCFKLLNGTKAVAQPHWHRLNEHPDLVPIIGMASLQNIKRLTLLSERDTYPEILRLLDLIELVLDVRDKAACTEAIEYLYWVGTCSRHIPLDRDQHPFLFFWASRLSTRFLDLLGVHHPVACIVTVYFAALVAQAPPVWWAVKWPRYLLDATTQLLSATAELGKWLEGPAGIIEAAALMGSDAVT